MTERTGEGRKESTEGRRTAHLDGVEGSEASGKTLRTALLGRAILAALLAQALLFSMPALADEVTDEGGFYVDDSEADSEDSEPDYASKGFYIGGIANYAVENIKNKGSWDNNWGASVRAGYRILPRLGLEGMMEWHRFESNDTSNDDFDTWTTTANARLYLTEGRIQPNILLGIGAMMRRGVNDSAWDANDLALRVGFGLDIYIYEGLAFIGQTDYVAAVNNIKKTNYFSAGMGLQYKF